jgi:predicted ArsR family transcriptional regulator
MGPGWSQPRWLAPGGPEVRARLPGSRPGRSSPIEYYQLVGTCQPVILANVLEDDFRPEDEGTGYDSLPARRLATLQEARALAHPLRVRILRLCLDQALTNKELAALLGLRPATVLHHVRTLVATGFLAEQEWRRGPRGSTEKPYRSTGKSWQLDEAMAGKGALEAVLEAVAAEVNEAGPDSVIEAARMALHLRPEQLDELVGRVRALIGAYDPYEFLADQSPEGDPYAMLIVLHRGSPPPGKRQ